MLLNLLIQLQKKEQERIERLKREERIRQEKLEREQREAQQRREKLWQQKLEAFEHQNNQIINTKEYQSTYSTLKEALENTRWKHVLCMFNTGMREHFIRKYIKKKVVSTINICLIMCWIGLIGVLINIHTMC